MSSTIGSCIATTITISEQLLPGRDYWSLPSMWMAMVAAFATGSLAYQAVKVWRQDR